MHKYSSKVANVDSMGCLRRQGNTDYPKYACGAVPYWKGKYKSYILHVYWFKHILQLHGTWNWFLMFNIMCFPRNSLDSAMLWSSHTYTVVTSAGRLTWMKKIGRKCGNHIARHRFWKHWVLRAIFTTLRALLKSDLCATQLYIRSDTSS